MSEAEFISAYDRFADAIFRHCYFRISDRERAKDLVQETFCRTWAYLVKGGEIENLRAFLYRVANNLIIDTYRKKSALSLDELAESGFEPSVDAGERMLKAAEVRRAFSLLSNLDQKSRALVIMRYFDDLGPKEIAKITGETENAVSVRLNRAVGKLRNFF